MAVTLDACWTKVPGGTAVAALALTARLAARDDIDVVGVAAAHRAPPPVGLRPDVSMRHHRLPRPLLADAWHHLGRPLVERLVDVDVVHATSIVVPATRRPLVVTIHDLFFLEHPEWFTRRGVRVMSAGLAAARRRADVVLASSDTTARACRAAGIEPGRVRVVRLGVEVSPVDDARRDEVRRRLGLHGRYVLWNGTIEPRKNLPGLLDAVALLDDVSSLDDVDLVLVGPRGWHDGLPADRLAAVRASGRRVHLLGFVARADLDALHAGAVVTCLPSLAEGFGLPIVEAMAQGTPVVVGEGTASAELIGDDGTAELIGADGTAGSNGHAAGIAVDPTDPAAIAAALVALLTDDDLARRCGAAGRRRAAQLSWDSTVAATVDAYEAVS